MSAQAYTDSSRDGPTGPLRREGVGAFLATCVLGVLAATGINYVTLASLGLISWGAPAHVMAAVLLSGATAATFLIATISVLQLRRTRRRRLALLAEGDRLLAHARARRQGAEPPSSEAVVDAELTLLRQRHRAGYGAFLDG